MKDHQMTLSEIYGLSGRAIRKASEGPRGVDKVTHDEIVALVGLVLSFGIGALAEAESEKLPVTDWDADAAERVA